MFTIIVLVFISDYILFIRFYFGEKTIAGNSFEESFEDFGKSFSLPFSRHLRNCFSEPFLVVHDFRGSNYASRFRSLQITLP